MRQYHINSACLTNFSLQSLNFAQIPEILQSRATSQLQLLEALGNTLWTNHVSINTRRGRPVDNLHRQAPPICQTKKKKKKGHVTNVTCDMWRMTHNRWGDENILNKSNFLCSLNKIVNYSGGCRAAPDFANKYVKHIDTFSWPYR